VSKVPILAVIDANESIGLTVAKFIESSGFAVESLRLGGGISQIAEHRRHRVPDYRCEYAWHGWA
jgi:hypothetical protein